MSCLLVRPEYAANRAVGAAARLVAFPSAELAQLVLQFRAHLALDRGTGDVRLERHGMFDARQVGAADLQQLVAAADAQPAEAVDSALELVIGDFLHP